MEYGHVTRATQNETKIVCVKSCLIDMKTINNNSMSLVVALVVKLDSRLEKLKKKKKVQSKGIIKRK